MSSTNNKAQAMTTLEQWKVGLITQDEALEVLESANVHGAFGFASVLCPINGTVDQYGYTGYDYTNQRWVTS